VGDEWLTTLWSCRFKVNKTSFPKVQDKGEASASVVFSAQIKFSLFPDEDGSVEVKDVACGFKITSLDVKVLSGNLKMLYKMLVSVFQEKLTSSVESDLAGTIRKTLPMLRKVPTPTCAPVFHVVYSTVLPPGR